MAAFINGLMKMSVRGIVIILIVLCVRLLLKKMRIGHKYIVGLWIMAFLFFIVPWKISLPVGFWGNIAVADEIWKNEEPETEGNSPGTGSVGNIVYVGNGSPVDDVGNMSVGNDTGSMGIIGNIGNTNLSGHTGNIDNTGFGYNSDHTEGSGNFDTIGITGGAYADHTGISGAGNVRQNGHFHGNVEVILASLWLTGLLILFGHMLYSWLRLRRKLMLSVPYRDNIRWAENIDMPMVFGPVRPMIYLPVTLDAGNLSSVIAHEEMHIRRKDGLLKMAAYLICLLHWFNPFIWAAYLLFGSDLEKACDEEVIRSMDREERKEYAYALVRIAAGEGKGKRRVFVAPIGFGEGNLKSRVKNVMRYKYMSLGIGTAVAVIIIVLSALFLTEAKESEDTGVIVEHNGQQGTLGEEPSENDAQWGAGTVSGEDGTQGDTDLDTAYNEEDLPGFFVEDLDSLNWIKGKTADSLSIEDCYITNRRTVSNRFFIDERGVLWGTGRNSYGQLGTGTYSSEEYYEEPVKIAEHVVSVDVSENSYFCIYLTESGELYGVGLNFGGLLLGRGSENVTYNVEAYHRVAEPVLLMTDVSYARAGRGCIVALKIDGSAYWWGEYSATTSTHPWSYESYENFWKLEEDDANPAKMFASEPKKIMDDCIYITTGTWTGAAINEAGELYTWGLNLFGQCGAPVTEDDYIRKPVKVMDGVKMVWIDKIIFDNNEEKYTDYVRWSTDYSYDTFILKEDNTLMAVGLNLGDQEQVTKLTGDLEETRTHRYGDSFVPVRAVEYSAELNMQALRKLEFGMSVEEAEEILNSSGVGVFHSYTGGLCAKYNQYYCSFDSQNRLESIQIQEAESRDGRFFIGMSMAGLRAAVEQAGGELTERADDGELYDGISDGYLYKDEEQRIEYSFNLYKDAVTCLWEIAMD